MTNGMIYFGYRSILVYRFGFTAIFYIYKQINKYIYIYIWDEAVNLTSELHDSNARVNHLRKKKKEKDLAESTGVVPAEYPLKVKLKLFSQL